MKLPLINSDVAWWLSLIYGQISGGTSSGTTQQGANIGTGATIYAGLSGTSLQFKSISAGTNVNIVTGATTLTISLTGSTSQGENVGTGTGIYAGIDSGNNNLEFKSLVAGQDIYINSASTSVTISAVRSEYDLIGYIKNISFNTTQDIAIGLSGGSQYIITDVLLTNNSRGLATASNGVVNTNTGRTGTVIYSSTTANGFDFLASPNTFGVINQYLNQGVYTIGSLFAHNGGYAGVIGNNVISQSTVYWSLGVTEGLICLCDIYIFGFALPSNS